MMSEQTKKTTIASREVLGIALFTLSAFPLVLVALALIKGQAPSGGGTAAIASSVVGAIGYFPAILWAGGFAGVGAALLLSDAEVDLKRHLGGFALTSIGLAVCLGAFSEEHGGSFGRSTGGALAGSLGTWAGALVGGATALATIWLAWMGGAIDFSKKEGQAPSISDALSEKDSDGVSEAEANALVPDEDTLAYMEEVWNGARLGAPQTVPVPPSPYPEDVRLRGEIPEGAMALSHDEPNDERETTASATQWRPAKASDRSADDGAGEDLARQEVATGDELPEGDVARKTLALSLEDDESAATSEDEPAAPLLDLSLESETETNVASLEAEPLEAGGAETETVAATPIPVGTEPEPEVEVVATGAEPEASDVVDEPPTLHFDEVAQVAAASPTDVSPLPPSTSPLRSEGSILGGADLPPTPAWEQPASSVDRPSAVDEPEVTLEDVLLEVDPDLAEELQALDDEEPRAESVSVEEAVEEADLSDALDEEDEEVEEAELEEDGDEESAEYEEEEFEEEDEDEDGDEDGDEEDAEYEYEYVYEDEEGEEEAALEEGEDEEDGDYEEEEYEDGEYEEAEDEDEAAEYEEEYEEEDEDEEELEEEAAELEDEEVEALDDPEEAEEPEEAKEPEALEAAEEAAELEEASAGEDAAEDEAIEDEPTTVLQPQAAPARSEAPSEPASDGAAPRSREELVQESGRLFLEQGRVAVSLLQRRFALDFDDACEILDELQERGLIGPYMGGQRRDILMTLEEWKERVGAS